jgi:hypothetical protein
MIYDWTDIFTLAIQTLPLLHQEILKQTMRLPGKRKKLQYTEAARIWNINRPEFEKQRYAALESIRRYLISRGVTRPGDLTLG